MIHLKTPAEHAIIKEAGIRLKRVMQELMPNITPGITTSQIDERAQSLIRKEGGEPGFAKVKGYSWATCLPINEQAVHTPPSDRLLKKGDVLTVDIGLYLKGFHTDHAITIQVGEETDPKIKKFLDVGRGALYKAIKKVKAGNYVADISQVIEQEIYSHGYKILKQLTGHGIGRTLHEDPVIPGVVEGTRERSYQMQKGFVCAVEIIYSPTCEDIAYEKGDKWSIVTRDGSVAACFEHTVAIFDKEPVILT